MADGCIDTVGHTHRNEALNDRALAAVLFDLSTDAIVAINEAQDIVAFSRGAERMFGYAVDDVLGRPLSKLLPQELRRTILSSSMSSRGLLLQLDSWAIVVR